MSDSGDNKPAGGAFASDKGPAPEKPFIGRALEVDGISKVFGSRKALDGISFDLPQGAFLSLFGPNGAGKTTLLRVLSTLVRPSGGNARICGADIKENADEARGYIGVLSHAPMLYPDLTAEENLVLYGRLYGVDDPQSRARDLLEAVGLSHRRHDAVRTFSRGMQQRASIARALVHDPRVVLLDEPYSGLDPHAVEILDGLIEAGSASRTYVMVSHDFDKGYAMCTHAAVLSQGRIACFVEKSESGSRELLDRYRTTLGLGVA